MRTLYSEARPVLAHDDNSGYSYSPCIGLYKLCRQVHHLVEDTDQHMIRHILSSSECVALWGWYFIPMDFRLSVKDLIR